MTGKVSPLAPAGFPEMPEVKGVALATANSGVRYTGRDDLLVVELAAGSRVAGTFTRSSTAAAPVVWCKEVLPAGRARVLVVNAGNANAFTGVHGRAAVEQTVEGAVAHFGCARDEVYVASTGVIGEPLDAAKITSTLSTMSPCAGAEGWVAAANAIRTTDTFAKGASRTVEIDGVQVSVAGIAKGSGMIAPNMATMLGFVFTDADIDAALAQNILSRVVDRSFNAITVDSDTSTNDTVLLFATGAAGARVDTDGGDAARAFEAALEAVCSDLAQQIVRDGEGATKFITVRVTGARDDVSAKTIALAIANSPLVKTAIAGEDANWGRVVMAVGKSGEPIDESRLRIEIGGVLVAENGAVHPDYREEDFVAGYMKGDEIDIAVDVAVGDGEATVWTCDLTHGYIEINADYRS